MTEDRDIPGTVMVQSIFGPMIAFERDHATRQIEAFGAHTRNEVAMLRSFVDAGDTVYDVGAHIGTFALPLASAAGAQGHLVAIEADRYSFAVLCRNIEMHGLGGRIRPLHRIAGAQQARFRQVRLPEHTSAAYYLPDPDGEDMPTIQLDDLPVGSDASRRVAVIKIDVEGMELAVLQSAEQTIARDRPILYVEIAIEQMARYDATPDQVDAFLRRYDYRFFRNIGDRNSTHDRFAMIELENLRDGGSFYDVLAVPADDARLTRAAGLRSA